MEEKLKKKLITIRLAFGLVAGICLIVGTIFTILFVQAKSELDAFDPFQMDSALFSRVYLFQCVLIIFYCFAFFFLLLLFLSLFACYYVKIPVEFNEAYLYIGIGTMTLFVNEKRAATASTKYVLSIEGRLKDNTLMEVTRTGRKQFRIKFSDNRPYLEIDAKTGTTKYFS